MCKSRQYLASETLKTSYLSLIIVILSGHQHIPHILNILSYFKRKPFELSLMHPQVPTLNLFFLSLIFYLFHLLTSFVFSHINKLLRNPLSSLFQFNCEFHDHLTRSRSVIYTKHLPDTNLQFAPNHPLEQNPTLRSKFSKCFKLEKKIETLFFWKNYLF